MEQTEFNVQTVLKDPDNFFKGFPPPLHKDEDTFRSKSGNVDLDCKLPLGEPENLWVTETAFAVDGFVPDIFEEDLEIIENKGHN